MNTGKMPTVSTNTNVGGENKKKVMVSPKDLMAQGESKARQDRMNLANAPVKNIKPSNRDQFQ